MQPPSLPLLGRRVFEQQITLTTQYAAVVYRAQQLALSIKLFVFMNCVQSGDCVCVYVYVWKFAEDL